MTGPADSARGRAGSGERAHVALLFADLCDYTALNEACDPEDIGLLKQQIEAEAKRVIGSYSGSINQFYGDGILAVFGYPAPGEDDVRRAVSAALELHEVVRGLRPALPQTLPEVRLHSGVHSGLVFVREGDPLHGRYELTGDAVNTAQRLCSAAGRDEIVVSKPALLGLEPFFLTEEIGPLSLKGKDRPVGAVRVIGRSDVETRFEARHRSGLTPFVGRAAELERLHTAFAAAEGGRCQVVCVTGSAGMGKSRLLDTFRRALPSTAAVYSGCCEQFGNVAPLRPFVQSIRHACFGKRELPAVDQAIARLREWLAAVDGAPSSLAPRLLPLLGLSAPSPASEADRDPASVVGHLFAKMARRGPAVLLLDDWQWADDASRQALGILLRSAADAPLLVVIGARAVDPDDILLRDAPSISLQPLTYEEAASAIRDLLAPSLDPALGESIHRRAGGSPLFIEELCRSLPPDVSGGRLDSTIPTTIHGLIQARAAMLTREQSDVLHAAAVIGIEGPCWLLERSLDLADARPYLARLAQSDLVLAEDVDRVFAFRHGIVRDVVYASVPIQTRRHLHAVVARALEDHARAEGLPEQYEALAYHYAGSADRQRAIDYSERAGDKALAVSALDRARYHYEVAFAKLDERISGPAERARWLRITAKWAAACVYNPAPSQPAVLTKAAAYAREMGATEAVAHAEYWLGWIHYALGEQEDAIRHSHEALRIAEPGGHLSTQLLANLGQSHGAAGQNTEALRYLDEAIALQRERATRASFRGIATGFVYALGSRALAHGDQGDFAAAYRDMDEALGMVRGAGHAVEGSLLGLLGMIQVWQGEWEKCVETQMRARATAEAVNGTYVLAMSYCIGGYARWAATRAPDALAELRQGIEWLESHHIGLFISFTQAHLADALVSAGDIDAARDFARRALGRAEAKDPIGETTAHLALARAALACDRGEVEGHLARALASAVRRGSARDEAMTRLLEGEALSRWGERARARDALEKAANAFARMNMPLYRERARALLV